MTSELVDGSAWMKPPVEGAAEDVMGAVAAEAVAFAVPAVPAGLAAGGLLVAAPPALPPEAAPNAARKTAASFVESAFFRCTTQMLPLAAEPWGCASSLAISERTLAILLALALRMMSELLRESTKIEGAFVVAPPPGAAPGVAEFSVRRWISGAMSDATA